MIPRGPHKEPAFAFAMALVFSVLVGVTIALLATGQTVLGLLCLAMSVAGLYTARNVIR